MPTRTLFRTFGRITLVGILFGMVALLAAAHVGHIRILAVQTSSMEPVFSPNDAVVIRPIPDTQIHVGNIVAYRSPLIANQLVTHRVIAVDTAQHTLTTQGDQLKASDPAVPFDQLVGKEVAIAPHGGTILQFLKRPIGLALLLYLPAAGIVLGEFRHLKGYYATRRYRLYGCRMV